MQIARRARRGCGSRAERGLWPLSGQRAGVWRGSSTPRRPTGCNVGRVCAGFQRRRVRQPFEQRRPMGGERRRSWPRSEKRNALVEDRRPCEDTLAQPLETANTGAGRADRADIAGHVGVRADRGHVAARRPLHDGHHAVDGRLRRTSPTFGCRPPLHHRPDRAGDRHCVLRHQKSWRREAWNGPSPRCATT